MVCTCVQIAGVTGPSLWDPCLVIDNLPLASPAMSASAGSYSCKTPRDPDPMLNLPNTRATSATPDPFDDPIGMFIEIIQTDILTLTVLVATIDTQWEGMGDAASARYEPALLPPCPTIRVLSYSN